MSTNYKQRSQVLVRKLIESIKDIDITNEEIMLIQYFINPDTNSIKPSYTPGLEQILSNVHHTLNVVKLDYILRDAQALRYDLIFSYKYDLRSLLQRSCLVSNDEKILWTFHIQDQEIVYDLICKHSMFYHYYYLDMYVTNSNNMLINILSILNKVMPFYEYSKLETLHYIEKYIELTDVFVLETILNSDDNKLAVAKHLLDNIFKGVSCGVELIDTNTTNNLNRNPFGLLANVQFYKNNKLLNTP